MKLNKTTTTKQSVEIKLTDVDILNLLRVAEVLEGNITGSVSFDAPTGGDYSGMNVGIDDDNYIIVRYEKETVE